MAIEVDNDESVDVGDEDELKKPVAPDDYAPVSAPDPSGAMSTPYSAPAPATETQLGMAAPVIPAQPEPEAEKMLTQGGYQPVHSAMPPPRPGALTAQDYAAVEPHGVRKALAATFAGMGAFKSPQLGQDIYNEEFNAPREKLQQQRAGEQQAYDTELGQGATQRTAQTEQDVKESEAAKNTATAEATKGKGERQPWFNPTTQTVEMIPQSDYDKIVQEETRGRNALANTGKRNEGALDVQGSRNEGSKDVADIRAKSAEDVARERAQSAERVATGRNLTSTEVARIRASAANDPNQLTNTMKTMKQQAKATLPEIDKTLDETEKVAAKLGPTEGRWNDFWQGKVGAGDKDYAHYKDQVGMVSSAVTLAHARGRMSNELFEHFNKMFDAGKQSPENMIQALNVAKDWLTGYASMGDEGSAQPSGGTVIKYDKQGNRVK